MRKKFFKVGSLSKEVIPINILARDLIRDFQDVNSFIKELKELGDMEGNTKQAHRELTIAYLFATTHSLEATFSGHPREQEVLDAVHIAAYSSLESADTDFNGSDYEQTLNERYLEFRKIMQSQSPSTVFFTLGEAIVRHIWTTEHEAKVGHATAIGIWLGNVMVANKKFFDEVIAKFDIK